MIDKSLYHVYENGGMKENKSKIDYTLIPYDAMDDVVRVMEYGANKYSRDNWMKVPHDEYIKAAFRHLVDFVKGEDYDQESGFHHLSHAICDVLYASSNYNRYVQEQQQKEEESIEEQDDKKQYRLFEEKLYHSDRVQRNIESILDAIGSQNYHREWDSRLR